MIVVSELIELKLNLHSSCQSRIVLIPLASTLLVLEAYLCCMLLPLLLYNNSIPSKSDCASFVDQFTLIA